MRKSLGYYVTIIMERIGIHFFPPRKFSTTVKLTGVVYTNPNEWGHALYWQDFDSRRVYGFHPWRMPQLHDEFHIIMASGKVGRFMVTEVDPQSDPPGYVFCKSRGYRLCRRTQTRRLDNRSG